MMIRSQRKFWIAVVLFAIVVGIPAQVLAQPELSSGAPIPYQFSASSITTALEEAVGIVNTGALNVRSGPGPNFGVVTVVYQGQAVSLLGRYANNYWVKVRLYSGVEGWVNSTYLNTNVPVNSLPVIGPVPAPPTPTPPIAASAVVATGALNIRSGPDVAYNVVAVAPWGEHLALLGRNVGGTWVLVRNGAGVEGWSNGYYLHTSVPISSLPIVSAPSASPTALVVTASTNVRTGPGEQYDAFAVLYQGQTVAVIGRSTDANWVQVRLGNGAIGWVTISAVQLSVGINSLPVVEVAPPSNAAVVNVGALNVRYGPGTGYGSFTVVYRGQVVTLLGRAAYSTWVQVRLSTGAAGWVNSNYLISPVSIDSLPVTWP
ncbi:MAG TPA: SH3 domain-containing protein [Patescibacteria group bacterium]|nr:SH3 domain-containing protein [Patescibacteria group bacterium]